MFYDNQDFYPTPEDLAKRMVNMADLERVHYVLEPSAGKGNLINALDKEMADAGYCSFTQKHGSEMEIDCIEADANLRSLLKGADRRVIYDDFLTFETMKKYDLILMNPPFSSGDRHLLKALEVMKDGGQIVCLLNRETLMNPYTNSRRELKEKLTELGAQIEYLEAAFAAAERPTMVETALIYVDIPAREPLSLILDSLEKPCQAEPEISGTDMEITYYDFLKRLVHQFNLEAKAGIRLINEYCRLQPYLMNRLKGTQDAAYAAPIFELRFENSSFGCCRAADMVNSYLKKLRYKYWYALGENPKFTIRLTSNLSDLYFRKLLELSDYDFNLHNIELVNKELQSNMTAAVEATVLALFDELSDKHSWYPECQKNIHYYNGWQTNTAHMINKKVIIPLRTTCFWNNKIDVRNYEVVKKLNDIEKVMDYLSDGAAYPYMNIERILLKADNEGKSKDIDSKYFKISFYKKGTVHLVFKDLRLLKKFNIFGSQKKAWLPPCYGKKKYTEMEPDEKRVIDEFEGGAKEYEKTLASREYYLRGLNTVMAIEG